MIHPPGPRGREVLDFFNRGKFPQPLAFLENTARRYGPLAYFRLLHQRTYLVTGPESVREVLITQQHRFGRDFGALILRELVGDSLITREEPLHRERRRVLQPAFHKEQIASYIETMSRETNALLGQWSAQAAIDSALTVDAGASMRALTLSIIGSLLFGEEFRSGADRISAILLEVMGRAKKLAPFATVLKVITRSYRRTFPAAPSLYFGKYRAELDHLLQPMVNRRQAQAGRDVLSLLIALRDEQAGPLSAEAIRNEIVTFVLAGHETTATALTWTLYLLATHPLIQERAAAEVSSVCGGRNPEAEHLSRLPLTSAILNETLRLYPPVPLFGRRVLEDATIDGYKISKNATVLLSPYITQRNELSFARPDAFEPSRWLDTPAPPRFSFFPFGGGAKMCIGDVFARTEATVILAGLLANFRFRLANEQPVEADAGVTLKPKQPVLLNVSLREGGETVPEDSRSGVPKPLCAPVVAT